MNQSENKDRGMNVLGAGIVGALAGAAAVFFSRKENRQKTKDKINQMVNQGEEKISEAQEKADELKQKGKKKISEELGKAKKKLEKD